MGWRWCRTVFRAAGRVNVEWALHGRWWCGVEGRRMNGGDGGAAIRRRRHEGCTLVTSEQGKGNPPKGLKEKEEDMQRPA